MTVQEIRGHALPQYRYKPVVKLSIFITGVIMSNYQLEDY